MNNNMIWIRYPRIRDEMFIAFKRLRDDSTDYYLPPGFDTNSQSKYYYLVIYQALMTLFEDLAGSEDYEEYTEMALQTLYPEEMQEVYDFCQYLAELLDLIGRDKKDEEYLNHPKWKKIESWATKIYEMMDANNKKYQFYEKCYQRSVDDWDEYQEYIEGEKAKQKAEQELLKSF